MTISLLTRLNNIFRGRNILGPHEQLIYECKEELERLQRQRIIDLERAATLVETFDTGKLRGAARKAAIAERIRDLK